MPSKKQYDLVMDDGNESKSPLHSEMAFQRGIHFQAKYIGTLDVPRPGSRVEIVAAMRRIRYEFKAKGIKKQKVSIIISVEGVKVSLHEKNKRKQKWFVDEGKYIVSQHPIYRIFYVSHDSQDLKIFSYIARDGSTNVFKCSVFKSYKKNQAMQIVRTIGQAFEVCHRISVQAAEQNEEANEGGSEKSSDDVEHAAVHSSSTLQTSPIRSNIVDPSSDDLNPDDILKKSQQNLNNRHIINQSILDPLQIDLIGDEQQPISVVHRMQLLLHQLELERRQTQFTLSQVQLLKDQLAAETAARIDAQMRANDLLIQNRGLIEHISVLVNHLAQLEENVAERSKNGGNHVNQSTDKIVPNCTMNTILNIDDHPLVDIYAQESPDSGHRDMSSDSLSFNNNTGQSEPSWHTPGVGSVTLMSDSLKGVESKMSRLSLTLPLVKSSVEEDFYGSKIVNSITQEAIREFEKSKCNLVNGGGFLTSVPTPDLIGKRIELNNASLPRIDPPPKVRRSSSRSSHVSPLAPISDSPAFRSHDWSSQVTNDVPVSDGTCKPPDTEKRYSWESYMLADQRFAGVVLDNFSNMRSAEGLNGSSTCNSHAVDINIPDSGSDRSQNDLKRSEVEQPNGPSSAVNNDTLQSNDPSESFKSKPAEWLLALMHTHNSADSTDKHVFRDSEELSTVSVINP